MHIVCYGGFFSFLFSTCHTEPTSLHLFHQLCNFGVFAVMKEMEIQTLAFFSLRTLRVLQRNSSFSPWGGNLSPSAALTLTASKGNLSSIRTASEGWFWIQRKILWTNQRQYTNKYIFNEHNTFFTCVNINYLSLLGKTVTCFWTLRLYREIHSPHLWGRWCFILCSRASNRQKPYFDTS